ncbi:hypothetical protein BCR44DRAFT_1427201, partial [Catenaria anguillulae PL171]
MIRSSFSEPSLILLESPQASSRSRSAVTSCLRRNSLNGNGLSKCATTRQLSL